ncbi:MAG: hypothetical protein ACNJA3_28480 (plasmid) [Pseudomonas rhizophila]|uniref:hypothetical protein n=1 Tax=Pseudomonas rhizophila TaxID=2045200 RepID=UPI003F6B8A5F
METEPMRTSKITIKTVAQRSERLLADALPEEVVTTEQVRQRFSSKEGVFESAPMRGEPSEDEIRQQVEALKVSRMGASAERAAISKYEGIVATGMANAFELWATGWTLTTVGARKDRQAPPGVTNAGAKYTRRGNEFMVGAKAAIAEVRSDASFLAALRLRTKGLNATV